ncbi:MAG TPA: Spy/CpxP family protein refolding chaperone [Caulobacteraceae bacterium]|nr:Spy/CpxP family protein refolding chaperone [Caulobacteraceae bacterium]
MNLLLRASASLAVMAAVISVAYAAEAQDQAPTPGSPPSAEQRAAWMHDRQEARAKALHAILNLRPDQEAAFQAFQAAMTPRPSQRHEHKDRGALDAMTTPQRLDRMADRMAKRQAEFQRRADAIKIFYAALSPDQQRAFDAVPLIVGGHRRGMGHGRLDHGPAAQG